MPPAAARGRGYAARCPAEPPVFTTARPHDHDDAHLALERTRRGCRREPRRLGAQIVAGRDYDAVEIAQALLVREQAYAALAAFFDAWDLLLCPSAPVVSWPVEPVRASARRQRERRDVRLR